jgi:16S rRNA (cytosine1402-N4)-methyltransferase
MVEEVLAHARPRAGDLVVDATVGDGGHTRALADAVLPAGLVVGLDRDPSQLARARPVLEHWGPGVRLVHANFADLPLILPTLGVSAADIVIADLGVSARQLEEPERGLHYKMVGTLDMRFDLTRGETAAALLARATEDELIEVLDVGADEQLAPVIARILKRQPIATSHALERTVRSGLAAEVPSLSGQAIKDSVRRTFQALRVAVNDEIASLDTFLRVLPECLGPGGRAVVMTFHEGENRRVRESLLAGRASGVYTDASDGILRPSRPEILGNRRSSSARLHWAIRA